MDNSVMERLLVVLAGGDVVQCSLDGRYRPQHGGLVGGRR